MGQAYGNRAGTLFALANFILDHLTFDELFDTRALNFGMMEKQVTPISLDKSKALFRNHFLNLTVWHCCLQKNLKLGQQDGFQGSLPLARNKNGAEYHNHELGTCKKSTAWQSAV